MNRLLLLSQWQHRSYENCKRIFLLMRFALGFPSTCPTVSWFSFLSHTSSHCTEIAYSPMASSNRHIPFHHCIHCLPWTWLTGWALHSRMGSLVFPRPTHPRIMFGTLFVCVFLLIAVHPVNVSNECRMRVFFVSDWNQSRVQVMNGHDRNDDNGVFVLWPVKCFFPKERKNSHSQQKNSPSSDDCALTTERRCMRHSSRFNDFEWIVRMLFALSTETGCYRNSHRFHGGKQELESSWWRNAAAGMRRDSLSADVTKLGDMRVKTS